MNKLNHMIVTHAPIEKIKDYKEVLSIERDGEGKIQTMNFNMFKLNEVSNHFVETLEEIYMQLESHAYKNEASTYYEKRLESVSKSGIVSHIPLTTLYGLPLLPFYNPTYTIKYSGLSNITGSLSKEVKNYGVNHIMIEINMEVKLQMTMTYPFLKEAFTQKIKVPLFLEIIEGQIPLIYNTGGVS